MHKYELQKHKILLSQKSHPWRIVLDPEDKIDFTQGETRTSILHWVPDKNAIRSPSDHSVFAIRMSSSSNITTPFTLGYTVEPLDMTTGVIQSCVLLCALYALIIFEVSFLSLSSHSSGPVVVMMMMIIHSSVALVAQR